MILTRTKPWKPKRYVYDELGTCGLEEKPHGFGRDSCIGWAPLSEGRYRNGRWRRRLTWKDWLWFFGVAFFIGVLSLFLASALFVGCGGG